MMYQPARILQSKVRKPRPHQTKVLQHSYAWDCALFFLVFGLFVSQISVAAESKYGGYDKLIVEQVGKVAIAKFNNPPRHTMDQTVVADLSAFLTTVEDDDAVRVVILTGASESIFIAHYDVGEIGRKSQDAGVDRPLHGMHRVLLKIEALSKPVIAVINGRAHGGGYETALACDFRFLSSTGTVGLPETGIGIIPGGGGTQRLPRLIGMSKAKELIMFGTIVNAEQALALGMVDHVAGQDDLLTQALTFAHTLAKRSPVALTQVKRVMYEGQGLSMEQALKVEQRGYYTSSQSVDWGANRREP